jgi:hypothetical protein
MVLVLCCCGQVLSELLEHLGDRHWMYSAALCSLAALHEARGDYEQVRACVWYLVRWVGRVGCSGGDK